MPGPGPMTGVRVLEIGAWIAGPAASMMLADWGADVVKIESLDGDPFRWIITGGYMPVNAAFELDNRGKRSVALDLETPTGRAIVGELLTTWGADVLVTNVRTPVLERWGFDHQTLLGAHPRLVYGLTTGYGIVGDERDRPGYDIGAFYSRSGVAAAHTLVGGEPPVLRGAFGDHITGAMLAAGIAAALYQREQTGRGQLVTTSLLRTGMYTIGQDLNTIVRTGMSFPMGQGRRATTNPVMNCYQAGDGTWFWLLGLQPDRHWPALARAVGRPEWIDDERYSSLASRRENAAGLIEALDAIFAGATRDEWAATFDRAGVWWEAVLSPFEVVDDPQVIAAGGFVEAPHAEGPARTLTTPVDFHGAPPVPRIASPEHGQHTEEVLLELGYDWDRLAELKDDGVIL
jgi:crotonobetainyl-CoA:carnitine CoA-transferase CaiB-like acyl-CoA transferase